jgi:hypothetical protein
MKLVLCHRFEYKSGAAGPNTPLGELPSSAVITCEEFNRLSTKSPVQQIFTKAGIRCRASVGVAVAQQVTVTQHSVLGI